jgi:hypothetical protein
MKNMCVLTFTDDPWSVHQQGLDEALPEPLCTIQKTKHQ